MMIRLTTFLVVFFGEVIYPLNTNNDEIIVKKQIIPEYVLLIETEFIMAFGGISYTGISEHEFVALTEDDLPRRFVGFYSIKEAMNYLSKNKITADNVHGFWKLGKKIPLKYKAFEHKEKVKVETEIRAWTEHQWSVEK